MFSFMTFCISSKQNAYSEGLSLTAGEGFTLDCESKASLAEIDRLEFPQILCPTQLAVFMGILK